MTPSSSSPSPAAGAWREEWFQPPGEPALRLRVQGCEARGADKPLVLHFHAGAFVCGCLDDSATVAGLLVDAGAAVASLDYPLAPAHRFPQAAEAGYRALQWLERQRRRLVVRQAPLYVAGEEAGANLAAAVAMMARDRAGPAVAGQILLSPMLDVCVATASQRDAHLGPVGCRVADGWSAYLEHGADALHPYAAPGSAQRLAGLPPTLLVSAGDDPHRDEAAAFAQRLRDAGVAAELVVLGLRTGWPQSFCRPEAAPSGAEADPPDNADRARWAAALGAHLTPFFQQTIPGSPA